MSIFNLAQARVRVSQHLSPAELSRPQLNLLKKHKAMNDSFLPVRFRHPNGLWVRGDETNIRVYNLEGQLVAKWILPSTALASMLHSKASRLYLANPSRFSFVVLDSERAQPGLVIDYHERGKLPLNWLIGFQPAASLQIVIRPPDKDELEFGEWGWRILRNWTNLYRKLVAPTWTNWLPFDYTKVGENGYHGMTIGEAVDLNTPLDQEDVLRAYGYANCLFLTANKHAQQARL